MTQEVSLNSCICYLHSSTFKLFFAKFWEASSSIALCKYAHREKYHKTRRTYCNRRVGYFQYREINETWPKNCVILRTHGTVLGNSGSLTNFRNQKCTLVYRYLRFRKACYLPISDMKSSKRLTHNDLDGCISEGWNVQT